MDSNKLLLGVYDNPDTVLEATENLIKSGYDIKDVYTPFAVHGLDRVMGVKRTRLSTAAFVFAMLGVASALMYVNPSTDLTPPSDDQFVPS